MAENTLYFGDNLKILRDNIRDETVDLIYLDPPFNSKANYNVLFRSPKGHESHAQITAFEDTWHWGEYRWSSLRCDHRLLSRNPSGCMADLHPS